MDRSEAPLRVERARPEDFERVYPLLSRFNLDAIGREEWHRLFEPPWAPPCGHRGFLLLRGDEVKGFLGALYSRRILGGEERTLCNMTSWIVDEDVRRAGIRLLTEMLADRDVVFTNFTPNKTVVDLLERLRFTELPMDHLLLWPLPAVTPVRCIWDESEALVSRLAVRERRLVEDHRGLASGVLLEGEPGACLVILRRYRWHIRQGPFRLAIPLARVHHVSRAKVFPLLIAGARSALCQRLRVFGLLVPERLMSPKPPFSTRRPAECRAFARGPLAPEHIDTLYSELTLLHQ